MTEQLDDSGPLDQHHHVQTARPQSVAGPRASDRSQTAEAAAESHTRCSFAQTQDPRSPYGATLAVAERPR
jgi:hypothetical protein